MIDREEVAVLDFIRRYGGEKPSVLDVGCGYGRRLKRLKESGFDVLGVEKNAAIVAENQAKGLPCRTPEELVASHEKFDVLLLSHIVEHFSPGDLIAFLDHYFAFLRPGGIVVIATPLMSPYFFDDFDHVRPYHPESFLLAFDKAGKSQMQYHGKVGLELLDIWYRRSPCQLWYYRGRHHRVPSKYPVMLLNKAMQLAHFLSFGLFGKTDGWVGAFRLTLR
jgi:SAM-dependent methyltransferase